MTTNLAETTASPIALVVGETLVDIVVTLTSHTKFLGGSPVNVACGLDTDDRVAAHPDR